jgi:hypothetical protein
VQKIADEDSRLSMPVIIGHTARDLDVAKLLATDRLSMPQWPSQTKDIPVWLRFDGILANGQSASKIIWNGNVHRYDPSDLVIPLTAAVVSWLNSLKDGSDVTITFAVNFDKVANAVTKTTFPLRKYTVKALVDEKPVITSVKDSKGVDILEGGTTADKNVTLKGTAGKGQVQIYDDKTAVELPVDVDPFSGEWTLAVTLSEGHHNFTAVALYGSGLESTARGLIVATTILTENFESVQPYIGRSIDIPSMLITLVSGPSLVAVEMSGTAIFPGKVLHVFYGDSDGPGNVRIDLKFTYSRVRFNYIFANEQIKITFYNRQNIRINEFYLKTVGPHLMDFSGTGIARIDFSSSKSDWFHIDNFEFTV